MIQTLFSVEKVSTETNQSSASSPSSGQRLEVNHSLFLSLSLSRCLLNNWVVSEGVSHFTESRHCRRITWPPERKKIEGGGGEGEGRSQQLKTSTEESEMMTGKVHLQDFYSSISFIYNLFKKSGIFI